MSGLTIVIFMITWVVIACVAFTHFDGSRFAKPTGDFAYWYMSKLTSQRWLMLFFWPITILVYMYLRRPRRLGSKKGSDL